MSGADFSFDARLSHASTWAADRYVGAANLAEENDRIFARTWQLVGRADQVAAPGEYFTTTVAGEPLIVVRDGRGVLLALSNVCRHRAGPVASGHGRRNSFQCGYHGWTYGLDGRLAGTREFEGVAGFDREECALPSFAADIWNGLVFVNLELRAAPLASVFADVPEAASPPALTGARLAARKEWTLDCNWKVYVDNYLEGYHIPIVHPGLHRELDYARYRTETRRLASIQYAPLRRAESAQRPSASATEAGEVLYLWVFPNLMLNVYADNYSTNWIVPLGPERTLTVFEWFFRNPELPEVQEQVRRTVAFSDEIQLEDIAICEAVQRGLRSRHYAGGRYSVQRENGVHHFHTLLAEFLQRA